MYGAAAAGMPVISKLCCKTRQSIVVSQPLLCLYFWFRIAIGDSQKGKRGHGG